MTFNENRNTQGSPGYDGPKNSSLFAHEAKALNAIEGYIATHNLGQTLSNLELHDQQSNRYFETDLVVISSFGVYVVELKHWSGRIEIKPNSWLQNNSFYKADPHKVNGFKAKLLRGLYERKFPTFPSVFFESVVVLTNPEVEATGCANPTTTVNNPTFESIDRFFQYLKCQAQTNGKRLSESQLRAYAVYIRNLTVAAPPKDFVFPGYEIVERLYQYDDRAEVIARRTDLRHRKLSRLRIFYLSSGDLHAREKATATLNAVEKIGDHPNILKVWDIPNEDNYLVEGSDWSNEGTLRDCLDRSRVLPLASALEIAKGLTSGLQAAHEEYVVHRSLSPENVLMINGVPKLMNFDLSFQLEENRVTVIPDVAKLKRTAYIAPEIYVQRRTPEASADLFSLGVVLYEMLVGERPFGCSTDLEQSSGSLRAENLKKLSNLPGKVVDLITRLIRLNPALRIQNSAEVLAILGECTGETSAPAPTEVNSKLSEGEQSGLYRITRYLCRGAEAQIYEAAGPQGKAVALKLFDRDVPLPRVVHEQRFAGTVRHTSLVRVDSYSQWHDGRNFIAFDWVSEQSMRKSIDEGARPDLQDFVKGAHQLLDALSALHGNCENGVPSPILHNDIKPENVLISDGRMVIIDFGAASDPHIGTYEGTEGYVAPDLRFGQDRDFCVGGDLFALSVCLHEWLFGIRPGASEIPNSEIPDALRAWLDRGTAPNAEIRFASVEEMRAALAAALVPPAAKPESHVSSDVSSVPAVLVGSSVPPRIPPAEPDHSGNNGSPESAANPFVHYLNSLHSGSAANENALAESQARNPSFRFIHVQHPLADEIEKTLTGAERTHVILTGHAGDGKTTIALEIFKRLRGIRPDEWLQEHLHPREDAGGVSLVKDFSEWSAGQRSAILAEMLDPNGSRFLLVSNTGTLLDTFKSEEARDGDPVAVESELLKAMGSSKPKSLNFRNTRFILINVAMMDNLAIAKTIFERMLAPERWCPCDSAACREKCPIYQNVTLLRANQSVALERIFLAYRRLYEYGTRLTLRQLTGHMAYLVTAGLDCQQIMGLIACGTPIRASRYLFFNRFFGDDGKDLDPVAEQLRGIQAVRQQHFGAIPCPSWERRMWFKTGGYEFHLNAGGGIQNDIMDLRTHAAGLRVFEDLLPEHARTQIRRVVYFLHEFEGKNGGHFLATFLRSNMILDFMRWQHAGSPNLQLSESSALKRRIMHVLQEHFTGVRLPEGVSYDKQLLVTLSRRSSDVRQSAQVVLANFRDDQFKIELREAYSPTGTTRRDLVLFGPSIGSELRLDLPFLDYVMLRNLGEIGQTLQASYVDRIERFKGQLIALAASERTDDLMLVRLKTNHTFRRQVFSVQNGCLEVTDA